MIACKTLYSYTPVIINSEALTIWLPFIHCKFAQNVYNCGAYFILIKWCHFSGFFVGNVCRLPKPLSKLSSKNSCLFYLAKEFNFCHSLIGFIKLSTAGYYVIKFGLFLVVSGNLVPNFNTYILIYPSCLLTRSCIISSSPGLRVKLLMKSFNFVGFKMTCLNRFQPKKVWLSPPICRKLLSWILICTEFVHK